MKFAAGTYISFLYLMGATVACSTPGETRSAKEGYVLLDPVIKAIEAYRQDFGTYPNQLSLLSPKYVKLVPESYEGFPIAYSSDSKTFQLRFSFKGGGMCECSYIPEYKWHCRGYY